MRSHHGARLVCAAALAAAAVACDQQPIEWKDPIEVGGTSGDALGRLTVDSTGRWRVLPGSDAPAAAMPAAGATAECQGSARTVKGTKHTYAAWWGMRTDSDATLFVSSTEAPSGAWSKPLAVDTTDVSGAGCSRPAPSVATVGDDVFVAYSLDAPEGRGVFFAHTMGGMVHEPVPVVYGERVVPTAIAAHDDRVVVAYEEPNGTRHRIDIAISETQGHNFAWHIQATRDVDDGRAPDVAVAGHHLAVSWMTRDGADSSRAKSVSRVVRAGRIK